jgi:hypothetical protein
VDLRAERSLVMVFVLEFGLASAFVQLVVD